MIAIPEQIKPEMAKQIATRARVKGLSIDDYVEKLLLLDSAIEPVKAELTVDEKLRLWRELVDTHSVKSVIADDSRESIYTREDEAL